MDNWIQTYSGIHFHILNPTEEEINIIDIAHALSLQCRYAGHCKRFYSVAEHSIYVMKLCKERYGNVYAKYGALHDAAEAYISDLARPVKDLFPGFKEMENNILDVILRKYNLYKIPKEVKMVDNILLATEANQILQIKPKGWLLDELPLGENELKIRCLKPKEAEMEFLIEFKKLFR